MNLDILRPITLSELGYLEILYKKNYDKTTYHYLLIYNQLKWNKYFEENHVDLNSIEWKIFRKDFYTHRNGNFKDNGTYFSFYNDFRTTISFFSLQSSLTELKECLYRTKLIEWGSGPLLVGVHYDIAPIIKEISVLNGGIPEIPRQCLFFSIDNIKAQNLYEPSSPSDSEFKVMSLSPENAEKIHSEWPNQTENSIEFIRGLIKMNRTLGIFDINSNELIAWIFQIEYSGIGILHVMPKYRGRGFAAFLLVKLTKEISKFEPINVSAFIVLNNTKSQNLFQKLGYKRIVDTFWINFKEIKNGKI